MGLGTSLLRDLLLFSNEFDLVFRRPLFFVRRSGFGRCCRFVVFQFKFAADLRALVIQNAVHVVNLIMRAHTNQNPAIGSSASRRAFLFRETEYYSVTLLEQTVSDGCTDVFEAVELMLFSSV